MRLGLYLSPSFGDRATQIDVYLSTLPFLLRALNSASENQKVPGRALAPGERQLPVGHTPDTENKYSCLKMTCQINVN